MFKELMLYKISFSGVISIFNQTIATSIYTEIISQFSQPRDESETREGELTRGENI